LVDVVSEVVGRVKVKVDDTLEVIVELRLLLLLLTELKELLRLPNPPQGNVTVVINPAADTTVVVAQLVVELTVREPGDLLGLLKSRNPPTPPTARIMTTTSRTAAVAIARANF
jgi:hypothetical protein